jgi:hypothetical protein
MARILGNPFGELRGKAGGSVFSRNKAGQFMRVYVKPTQANSIAQSNARASFGAVSQAWGATAFSIKTGWNGFATAGYNPLRVTNIGQFTGQNAYIALGQSAFTSQRRSIVAGYEPIGGGAGLAYTPGLYQSGGSAPTDTVISAVTGFTTTGPQALSVQSLTMPSRTEIECSLMFGNGTGIAAGQLVDYNGKAFGIGFYLSDPVTNLGMKYKNRWYRFAGNTEIATLTTPLTGGTLGINIHLNSIDWTEYKDSPQANQWVYVTPIVIGADGSQAVLNSFYVQIA